MSKEFPDRHPKLKGDHRLLAPFRKWFQRCEKHPEVISIIPSEVKKDSAFHLPEERWKRNFGKPTLLQASEEPVVSVPLTYGALSQEVRIIAKNREALRAIGLAI